MTKKISIKFTVVIFALFLVGAISCLVLIRGCRHSSSSILQNRQEKIDNGKEKISYSVVNDGKHDDLKGKRIQWTGMISDRSHIDGIKFCGYSVINGMKTIYKSFILNTDHVGEIITLKKNNKTYIQISGIEDDTHHISMAVLDDNGKIIMGINDKFSADNNQCSLIHSNIKDTLVELLNV